MVDGLYSIIHCCENFAAYLGIPTKDCSASNRDEQLSLLDFLDEENRISLQKCLNLHNVVGSQTEVASPQPMYLPVSIRALELHERSGRKRKRRSYYFRISSTSSTASSSPSSSPQSIMEEGESEGLLLGTSTTANTAAGSPCFEVQIVCA